MTPLSHPPRHPVRPRHLRHPHLRRSLAVQAQLDHPPQQIQALLPGQHLHRLQRPRPAHPGRQPGQTRRQRPQPRQHRLRARRQLLQPVLFHLRLPFRSPGHRNVRTLRNGSLTHTQTHRTHPELTPKELHPCDIAVVGAGVWTGREARMVSERMLAATASAASVVPAGLIASAAGQQAEGALLLEVQGAARGGGDAA